MSRFQSILLLLLAGAFSGTIAIHALQASSEKETGLASWYGMDAGAMTASGEKYNPQLLTAAHRKLPFNTLVKVTNRQNGHTVEVRINDRGPFTGGRILDLSEAAADALDMKQAGVVPVEIEIMPTHQEKK